MTEFLELYFIARIVSEECPTHPPFYLRRGADPVHRLWTVNEGSNEPELTEGTAMLKNTVIVSRAWAAFDELQRWDTAVEQRVKELDTQNKRVVFVDDPLLNPDCPTDHTAVIWSRAAEIIEQHKYYVKKGIRAEDNLDAVAAWKLVLRTRDREEIEKRLRVAINASARVFPRCKRIFEDEARKARNIALN